MSVVEVGSARSSFGNTSPGDQSNGKEVSKQEWYLHAKGWVLLRPISDAVAEMIACAMDAACRNNLIGYDQATRNTLYNAIKELGFDPSKCKKKVNTDCSALVRVCMAYAGVHVKNFTTSDMVSVLMNSGAFTKFTDKKFTESSQYLCRGDILVTKTKGHTVVVLKNGSKAEIRGAGFKGKYVKIADGSWNVRKGPGTNYETTGMTVHGGEKYPKVSEKADWVEIAAGWIGPKAVKSDG